MPIAVECPNGHRVRVRDKLAGKLIKCPRCETPARVPAASESQNSPARSQRRKQRGASNNQHAATSELPPRRASAQRKNRRSSKTRNPTFRVGRGVLFGTAGAILLLLVTLVLLYSVQDDADGFDTPAQAFAALQTAIQQQNWEQAARCTTEESQSELAAGLTMLVSFMGAFQPSLGSDIEALFAKHGLNRAGSVGNLPSSTDPVSAFTQTVTDKPALIAGLLDIVTRMDPDSVEEPVTLLSNGRLQEAKITGTTAVAAFTSGGQTETIEFRQRNGLWLVHLSEDMLASNSADDIITMVHSDADDASDDDSSRPYESQETEQPTGYSTNSRPVNSAEYPSVPSSVLRQTPAAPTDHEQPQGSVATSSSEFESTSQFAGLKMTATVSREVPFGLFLFPDMERQNPIFLSVKIQGPGVVNSTQYGHFQFQIQTDDGQQLNLLKPLEGKFNENLQQGLAELDHFFLDQPDTLTLHLVVQNPPKNATAMALKGSFRLVIRETITVDQVLQKLNRPLAEAGLRQVGRFVPSRPRPSESSVSGALAIDFTGNRQLIDDIELLDGKGNKISTGGTGGGSARQARYIRWTGEDLTPDTKLRILLNTEPKTVNVPLEFAELPLRW